MSKLQEGKGDRVMSNKIRVLGLEHDEGCVGGNANCHFARKDIEGLYAEIDMIMEGDEIGAKWIITLKEMDEKDYDNLPEFEGW